MIGLVVQGSIDLYNGKLSPGSHYLAAAVGGGVAGWGTLYLGPGGLGLGTATAAGIAGAAGSASSNIIRQSADVYAGRQESFSGTSLSLETGFGGFGSAAGAKILPAALSTLSNQTKGAIGEATSLATNVARGNLPIGSQVELGTFAGRTPVWDWQFRNIFTGSISTVESKFGTAGLTGAQRAGAPFIPNLSIEKWTYGFWGGVGSGAGVNAGAFGRIK